jgi:hypothetical protein
MKVPKEAEQRRLYTAFSTGWGIATGGSTSIGLPRLTVPFARTANRPIP